MCPRLSNFPHVDDLQKFVEITAQQGGDIRLIQVQKIKILGTRQIVQRGDHEIKCLQTQHHVRCLRLFLRLSQLDARQHLQAAVVALSRPAHRGDGRIEPLPPVFQRVQAQVAMVGDTQPAEPLFLGRLAQRFHAVRAVKGVFTVGMGIHQTIHDASSLIKMAKAHTRIKRAEAIPHDYSTSGAEYVFFSFILPENVLS
jgi:hypothetical protein